MLFLLVACTAQKPSVLSYTVLSSVPVSESQCASDSPLSDESFGVSVRIVDAETKRVIIGGGTVSTQSGTSTSGSTDGFYACASGSNSVLVKVYASNHTPAVFVFNAVPRSFTTIEVPLELSCSQGLVCLNQLKTEAIFRGTNDSEAEKSFNDAISEFNLTTGYTLSCAECNLNRGGFVRLQGTLADGTAFSASKRHGWCSSGGSDCGGDVCISGSPALIDSQLAARCSLLHSYYTDLTRPTPQGQSACGAVQVDTTNDTIARCLAGEFLYVDANQTTLSLMTNSNRCFGNVTRGPPDCTRS